MVLKELYPPLTESAFDKYKVSTSSGLNDRAKGVKMALNPNPNQTTTTERGPVFAFIKLTFFPRF